MTRKEMERCRSLRHEIRSIEESMKSPKSTYVALFWKDYRSGKGIPRSSIEVDDGEEYLLRLGQELEKRRARLIRKLGKAEKFIDTVKDPEMRTILRMYYINCDSQQEIAVKLHYAQTTVSKKIRTFWFAQAEAARKKAAEKEC